MIGEQKTETITNMDVITKFADTINKKSEGKTKTQYLLNNTTWKPGTRKTYMNKLSRMEASTIFKARTRMLDVKNNFRGKYNDVHVFVICRKCVNQMKHENIYLTNAKGYIQPTSHKQKKTDIFSNEHTELRDTANKITNIMTKLMKVPRK